MKNEDIKYLSIKAHRDAEKLNGALNVVDTINKISLFIIGITGVIASIAGAQSGPVMFLAVILATIIIMCVVYLIGILSTHVARVLSNNSIISLGILEQQLVEKTDASPLPKNPNNKVQILSHDIINMSILETIAALENRGFTVGGNEHQKYIVRGDGITHNFGTDESLKSFLGSLAKQ
jgi:hypothetical protein